MDMIGNLKFAKERRVRDITSSITVAATYRISIFIIIVNVIVFMIIIVISQLINHQLSPAALLSPPPKGHTF